MAPAGFYPIAASNSIGDNVGRMVMLILEEPELFRLVAQDTEQLGAYIDHRNKGTIGITMMVYHISIRSG